jgi:dTDP-L-rhamnose 4-epimerase
VSTLITGGAGFIGSRLARSLLADGEAVWILDSLHPQVHPGSSVPADLPTGARFLPADVTHGPGWDAVLKVVRPDTIVHLAAETGTGQSLTESSRHGRVNVVGTTEMLDALVRAEHVPDHFVLASSRAVYGEGAWLDGDEVFYPGPRRHEDLVAGRWDPQAPSGGVARPLPHCAGVTEPRPTNIYAATKLTQEHLLDAWGSAFGSRVSVLRLQNVFGPGQSVTNSYTGVLTLFARLAMQGLPIEVYEDGEINRDFVFVGDVVAALRAAVRAAPDERRLVDIGSGECSTILQLARLIAAAAGANEPKVSGNFRDGDVRSAWADIEAARTELGYEPATSLEEAVAALVGWVGDSIRHD